jgi:hypothetical protein
MFTNVRPPDLRHRSSSKPQRKAVKLQSVHRPSQQAACTIVLQPATMTIQGFQTGIARLLFHMVVAKGPVHHCGTSNSHFYPEQLRTAEVHNNR